MYTQLILSTGRIGSQNPLEIANFTIRSFCSFSAWGITIAMKWGLMTCVGFFAAPLTLVMMSACSSPSSSSYNNDRSPVASPYGATAAHGGDYRPVPAKPAKSPSQLYREANVKKDIIPRGRHARKYIRSMRPRYITIHSTQNYSRGADAWRHSLALKNGKLRARKRRGGNRIGYLVWHFTVDQSRVVQHLPTNEQGEHADFHGPGNKYSIGIEMCENRGNSRSATVERTAKLIAYLMHQHNIPLRKVVPHYHWPRRGLSQPHKNCPHFLLDNGHPGAKWQWFLAKVNKHYKSITVPTVPLPGQVTPYNRSASVAVAAVPRAVTIPPKATAVTSTLPSSRSVTPKPQVRYYTVKRGDTLYGLSRRYNTTVAAIKLRNGLRSNTIGVGQRLRMP